MTQVSQDHARLVLPSPPTQWTPAYQRRLNERIQQLIGSQLGINQIGAYGGVPHFRLTGTNVAFPIVVGTYTKLPFNDFVIDHDPIIQFDPVTFSFTALQTMSYMFYIRIAHNASTAANITGKLAVFVNGVATVENLFLLHTGQHMFTGTLAEVEAGSIIDIRVDGSSAFNIDMTKSIAYGFRGTADPRLTRP